MSRCGVALALLACLGCAGNGAGLSGLVTRGSETPVLLDSAASEVPPPSVVGASDGQLRAVPLRWDPVLASDVGGYVVERAPADSESFEPVATVRGRFTSAWVDRGTGAGPQGLGDGSVYRYRVRSFDTAGRPGISASGVVQATTAPPPAPPAGVRAYSHLPRRVALTWLPAADAAGYVVYRSPSAAGSYEPIARLRGRFLTHHLDTKLGDLRVFHYRVASVNSAGGEGPASDPTRAVTKAGPLPPFELRLEQQRLGANRLAWEPNVERDLSGYRLLRRREDGRTGAELVAKLPADTTAVWDEAVGAGDVMHYQLVALDRDGLESAPSDALRVQSVGYELEARPVSGGVRLAWRARPEEGLDRATVLRGTRLGAREIARVTGSEFVDRDVVPGASYRYQVVLETEERRPAPPSRWVEVSLPAEASPR